MRTSPSQNWGTETPETAPIIENVSSQVPCFNAE